MKNLRSKKYTLGVETSCDDSSVSLVADDGEVLDLLKWTADEDHVVFGGIIPERASRNHLKALTPLIEKILKRNELDFTGLNGIAVTNRPGLNGSLIVGVVTAQTLAHSFDLPLVGVNHLEGHILSPWLFDEGEECSSYQNSYPQISLIVSGGHTQIVFIEKFGSYKILGRTQDDAVGEAIDKFSNIVGLGFPGGPKVDLAARDGDVGAYNLPRPMMKTPDYKMSFSGLKAAGARLVESLLSEREEKKLSDLEVKSLCAAYLESAVDVLSFKLKKALEEYKPKVFTVVGGVSANSQLRARLEKLSLDMSIPLCTAKLKYCTDNGAMIGLAGAMRIKHDNFKKDEEIKVSPRSFVGDFL